MVKTTTSFAGAARRTKGVMLGAISLLTAVLSGCSTVPEDPFLAVERGRIVNPDSVAEVGPLQLATPMETPEPVATLPEDSSPSSSKDDEPKTKIQGAQSIPSETVSSQQEPSAVSQKQNPNQSPKPIPEPRPPADATLKRQSESSVEPEVMVSVGSNNEVAKPEKAAVYKTHAEKKLGSLKGKVNLMNADNNEDLLGDETSVEQGVIILLESVDKPITSHSPRTKKTHVIDMKDKVYLPGHVTISSNDKVSFINRDKIKHNVFSSTGKNAFDLGTYGAGLRREVALLSQGIVKVYCNIHPEMATFIGVSKSGFSAITDENGEFIIADIPPGKYQVHIWHIRGELKTEIVIDAGRPTVLTESLTVGDVSSLKHMNKHGKKYNKNATIFSDEFY